MTQSEIEGLPSCQLFEHCASDYDDDRYWEEFVRRFNNSLTLSVCHVYRRLNGESQPPFWLVSDLLQEVYLKILKDRCAILRGFRGESEIEAEVYLMHTAISSTIDYLRRQNSVKRYVQTESLDRTHLRGEFRRRRYNILNPYTGKLAEDDVIKILRRNFTGLHSRRNIMIFLLHFREGFTAEEIADSNVFNLKPSSIAHILDRMREKLRKVMLIEESP
jgi:RNA polymerase sigma factor (sigma-70 family)